MNTIFRVFLVLVFYFGTWNATVRAQIASMDLGFNTGDLGFEFGDGANTTISCFAIQPDGKIIIGGSFDKYNGTAVKSFARLNSDGSLDPTFNISIGGITGDVQTIVLLSSGKILIAGTFSITTSGGHVASRLARLNSDGSVDTDFNIGTGPNSNAMVRAIQVLSDGKILIGGDFTSFNGTARNRIARLNENGGLDATFDPGSGADNTVRAIAVQSDGKVLIGGNFTSVNENSRARIARLNADGSFDSGFTIGTGFNNTVQQIVVQNDGKIVVVGNLTSFNSTTRGGIARLNQNGSLDTSFAPSNGTNNPVQSVAIQSDGKYIIGGNFTTYNGVANPRNYIARVNSDGSIDSGFNPQPGSSSFVYQVGIQSDGKIIAVGQFDSFNAVGRNSIARVNTNGSLDLSFFPATGVNGIIWTTVVQPDGKILIGGEFTLYNGISRNRIARLHPDGSLDTTFDPGLGAVGSESTIFAIALQSDGKIVVGGHFTSFNGQTANRLIRLNSNGSIDHTFSTLSGANSTVHAIAIQPDGNIIIAGSFTSYKGVTRNRIARVSGTNAALDTSFDPGTGANGTIRTLVIQSSGRIVIGGFFSTFNSTTRNKIARLNANGLLDGTFNIGTGANGDVYALVQQSDGGILVGGDFSTFNSQTRRRIARITSTGFLDNSFTSAGTAIGIVRAIEVQADNKIVVGGTFSMINGVARTRLARLNSDGSVDTSFDPGAGANNAVYVIKNHWNKSVLIAGDFTAYNNVGRNRLARVVGDCDFIYATDEVVACGSYTWLNGITYTQSTNAATHNIVGAGSNGCDSLIILNLTINQPSTSSINGSILSGQTFNFHGQNLTSAGIYTATIQNAAGCDSTITLTLTVLPSFNYELNSTNNEICAGDEVTLSVLIPDFPLNFVHCDLNYPTVIASVTNPFTGKTWMDRNLGADRVALSSNDAQAYGSLFQWGRFGDGHQCVYRYAGNNFNTSFHSSTLSNVDQPPHGNFILVGTFPNNWRSPQNADLWQGGNGVNNPCPSGYRVPTELEWIEEKNSWDTENATGAFASPLKLPLAGYRNRSNGSIFSSGSNGFYWSSTVNGNYSSYMFFDNNSANTNAEARAQGNTVRCIKN